jgi:hypothetical protein
MAVNAVGAYARVRKQFRVPIAEMGGVQEALVATFSLLIGDWKFKKFYSSGSYCIRGLYSDLCADAHQFHARQARAAGSALCSHEVRNHFQIEKCSQRR